MNLIDAFFAILAFFKGDMKKTLIWFSTDNPGLGNIKPIDMIKNGRTKKLIKFIESSLQGFHP